MGYVPSIQREVEFGNHRDYDSLILTSMRTTQLPSEIGLASFPLFGSNLRLSRRQIGAGLLIAGGSVFLSPRRAEAGIWGFVAKAVASAAIGWFVGKVLDDIWADKVRDAPLLPTGEATPVVNNTFHNTFKADWQIELNLPCRPAIDREGYYISNEIKGFLRSHDNNPIPAHKDINFIEMRSIERFERVHGRLLNPCDYRRRLDSLTRAEQKDERRQFAKACRRLGYDSDDFSVHYCRPFNDGGVTRAGWGVTVRDEKESTLEPNRSIIFT